MLSTNSTNKVALKIALPLLFVAAVLLAAAGVAVSPAAQEMLQNVAGKQMILFSGLMFCAACCVAAVWTTLRTTRRLRRMVESANQLSAGDLSVEFAPDSKDEIGQLQTALREMVSNLRETAAAADQIAAGDLSVKVTARSEKDRFGIALENMLGNVLKLIQSKEEKDNLQRAIMKLLDDVADVANGDLTAQADVTADATGAIADAFNYMIDELREVVSRVQIATAQVDSSADEIKATTDKLATGSEAQAHQIALTSLAIEEMTVSIGQVSQNAARSSEVAEESLLNARHGARSVENNIQAMYRIRNQVQETAKRIKRLGERSQEIGEIVQLIDDIAERTGILALNASLQAAAAGEKGRGFATVAEEVERLATASAEATRAIAGLTKSIQLETKETVASMEETVREVVDGSQLANEAGLALQEIERVSTRLADLINAISGAAEKQTVSSAEIARSMMGISEVTDLVASESKQAANSVKGLVSLTDKLQSSVAAFKLSNQPGGVHLN